MNIISDYASRHPIQCDDPSRCAVCKFVSETMDSVVMNLSVEDIITGRSSMPWTNRRAWSEIQDECDTLRKVKFFRSKGTKPNGKSKNLRQVRRHMSAGTILSHDNLLVNPHTPPLGPVQERIVVPESVLHGLLTIMHLRLNHPSSHQLSKVFSRYFYGLCSDKVIKEVSNACPQCAAIRDVPTALSKESTEPPPTTVGGRFAADIIKRCKQKVFCIRETVTSYTQALLIPDETRESISNAIIRLCNLLRPSNESQITIRLDPAPAHQSLFQSLKSNSNLLSSNISLDIGRIFNKNKNPVIDKGIKELNREILVLQPSGGQVSQNVLSQAVANLNCRYRSTGMSSQELWTQRDQITGEQLPISDRDIILHQYQTRIKNHPYSEKCKAHGRPPNPTPQIKIGSLVYVYADRSKVNARQRYMVTAIQGENIKLKKFTETLFGVKEYDAKLSEVYLVPSTENLYLPSGDDYSSSDDDQLHQRIPMKNRKETRRDRIRISSEEEAEEELEEEEDEENYADIDDQSEESDHSDPTVEAPRNLAPAMMTRQNRMKKQPDRFGEWV